MMFLTSLLAVCIADTAYADLAKLGQVSRFEDPRIPFPFNDVGLYFITNDGKRVYQHARSFYGFNSYGVCTWEAGGWDVFSSNVNSYYKTKENQAFVVWKRYPRRYLTAPGLVRFEEMRLKGILSNREPYFFAKTRTGVSAVVWLDVLSFGQSQRSGIWLIGDKTIYPIDVDIDHGLVIALKKTTDPKLQIRAFAISSDKKSIKPIPTPAHLRRLQTLGGWHRVSQTWRWVVKDDKEYDLTTGTSSPIGERASDTSGVKRSYGYLGEDLLVYETSLLRDSEGHVLRIATGDPRYESKGYLWDRKAKKLIYFGPYGVLGKSPNGKFIVFQKLIIDRQQKNQGMYFVSRK